MSDDQNTIEDLQKRIKTFEDMLAAEAAGIKASDEGKQLSDNPFSELNLKTMWVNGWWFSQTQRQALQAVSVIKWTIGNLDHIHELSKGYGQDEIASKIELIHSKLKEFYSEQDN